MNVIGWLLILGFFYIICFSRKNNDVNNHDNPSGHLKDNIDEKPNIAVIRDPMLQRVMELLSQKRNIFITGGAGTGKSYMLQQLKEHYGYKLHLTSTTGISAININGQTIHAWSGIGIEKDPKAIWKVLNRIITNPILKKQILNCQMLAIDEISMLHRETLEFLDMVLQKIRRNSEPMGGIQIIFIGDFFQLPPVVKNKNLDTNDFCFSSSTWKKLNFATVLLKDVKRQSEIKYINVLNHIREGVVNDGDWDIILDRYNNMPIDISNDKTKLHLYATNKEADGFNEMCFELINSPATIYKSEDKIDFYDADNKLIYTEKNKEKFDTFEKVFEDDFRVLQDLKLKKGCRVMLLKNLDIKSGLANGSCGTVTEIGENVVVVKFDNGRQSPIPRMEFETFRFKNISVGNPKEESYKQRVVRKQIPLRLAYGITIHKSQGMTFDELVVHLNKIFAEGQCYVALSRTTSLAGLNPVGFDPSKIAVNQDVINFYRRLSGKEDIANRKVCNIVKDNVSYSDKYAIIKKAIDDKRKIRIIYQKSSDFSNGEVSTRIIRPMQIGYGDSFDCGEYVLNSQQVYVKGFCELRKEDRTFQLDRIIKIEVI